MKSTFRSGEVGEVEGIACYWSGGVVWEFEGNREIFKDLKRSKVDFFGFISDKRKDL